MTLRRQLLLAISLIFALVFLGLQALNVYSTRAYLQQQLASHAQETATNLSRTLAKPLVQGDTTLAAIEIQPIFDRGYFSRIAVFDLHGKVLLESQPDQHGSTSHWLASYLPLQVNPGEAFISSGWKQLGKVVVISHPAHAYDYLLSQFWRSAAWMLALYLLALALSQLLLGLILRPLATIEQVAQAIQEKRFTQIESRPKARELERVVNALNQMSARLANMLDEALSKADKFRRLALQDQVTGLQNRSSFDLRLQQLLQEEGAFSQACLFVVEIEGLKEINQQRGYQQGDQVLRKLAQALASNLSEQEQFLARLGGNAMAALLLDLPEAQQAQLYCQQRQSRLHQVAAEFTELKLSCAAVNFSARHQVSEILSALDLALASARHGEMTQLPWRDLDQQHHWALGSTAWRKLISGAIREQRLHLYTQACIEISSGKAIHHEIFARLQDPQGQLIPANVFLPMALRHQLMPELDQAMLQLILQRLQQNPELPKLSFNLSQQSLQDANFRAWFKHHLQQQPALAQRLCVELSEYRCAQNWPILPNLLAEFKQLQLDFAIDHFVGQAHMLSFLRQHQPAYLKLDAQFLQSLSTNAGSYSHWRSLQEIAQTLGIPLIVQNVEDQAQAEIVRSEALNFGQGYYFGAPSAKLRELS